MLLILILLIRILPTATTTITANTTTTTTTTAAAATTTPVDNDYEVSRVHLGGIWEWTLEFSEIPFNENNYVNPAATAEPNIVGGNFSGIIGGQQSWVTNDYATVGGGSRNSVSGMYGTIRGGIRNTVKGNYATLTGGAVNKIHSNYGTVLGGYKNTIKARFATALGGVQNTASGRFSVVAGQNAFAQDDYSAVFNFNNDLSDCESMGENTIHFCADRITFGDSNDPTDLVKLLASIDDVKSGRALNSKTVHIDDAQIPSLEDRLLNVREKVTSRGQKLSLLLSKNFRS
jgi:hypothetical protein